MLDATERERRRITVRSGDRQLEQLLEWANGAMPRTWAVEAAGGMGYLLSQQLVVTGEMVLNVPATLASRVPVLSTRIPQVCRDPTSVPNHLVDVYRLVEALDLDKSLVLELKSLAQA